MNSDHVHSDTTPIQGNKNCWTKGVEVNLGSCDPSLDTEIGIPVYSDLLTARKGAFYCIENHTKCLKSRFHISERQGHKKMNEISRIEVAVKNHWDGNIF